VKYLREFGWEPIVYTPLNPEAGIRDESLLKDIPEDITVLMRKITEPYALFKFFTGRTKDSSFDNFVQKEKKTGSGFKDKLSVWIRGNFFIPDARCMWIRPSVKFLRKWLKENPVDVIVSTGTPHSMHLIAHKVMKKLQIPWLADFRDPWTKIDFYEQLPLTKCADKKHRKLEMQVLSVANRVVTVSPNWGKLMENLGAKHVTVINNGYDDEDFEFLPVETDSYFSVTHVGVLNKDRNISELWQAFAQLCSEIDGFRDKLKLRFLGSVDYSVKEALEKLNLSQLAEFTGYVSHDEALKITAKSTVLLLLLNNTHDVMGRIPGKLYEYLAAQRPVLLIGPENCDSHQILEDVNAGYRADFGNIEEMKAGILSLWNDFQQKTASTDMEKIKQYERRQLTSKLAGVLNEMIAG
jgi:glycosyltransferase involved in cell wall biosynthesis